MEEELGARAPSLGVDVSAALVTAVGFQSLVGPEFGEARIAAEPVYHAAIADLVQDLPHTQALSWGLTTATHPLQGQPAPLTLDLHSRPCAQGPPNLRIRLPT